MYQNIIVAKYGSSSVSGSEGMDMDRLGLYVQNIAEMYDSNKIIVVSSGAVAVGRYLWSQSTRGGLTLSERSAAMLGSANVVTAWQQALGAQGLLASQLLVTHREIEDAEEGPSLHDALRDNLAHGIITIVNENDGLSVKELKKLAYGEDNDGLAAHLAITLGASALCLMTDTEGLIGNNAIIRSVSTDTERHKARSYAGVVAKGQKGGGRTKVGAAIQTADAGIDAYWAHARTNYKDVLAGKSGTHFVAREQTGNI